LTEHSTAKNVQDNLLSFSAYVTLYNKLETLVHI